MLIVMDLRASSMNHRHKVNGRRWAKANTKYSKFQYFWKYCCRLNQCQWEKSKIWIESFMEGVKKGPFYNAFTTKGPDIFFRFETEAERVKEKLLNTFHNPKFHFLDLEFQNIETSNFLHFLPNFWLRMQKLSNTICLKCR